MTALASSLWCVRRPSTAAIKQCDASLPYRCFFKVVRDAVGDVALVLPGVVQVRHLHEALKMRLQFGQRFVRVLMLTRAGLDKSCFFFIGLLESGSSLNGLREVTSSGCQFAGSFEVSTGSRFGFTCLSGHLIFFALLSALCSRLLHACDVARSAARCRRAGNLLRTPPACGAATALRRSPSRWRTSNRRRVLFIEVRVLVESGSEATGLRGVGISMRCLPPTCFQSREAGAPGSCCRSELRSTSVSTPGGETLSRGQRLPRALRVIAAL